MQKQLADNFASSVNNNIPTVPLGLGTVNLVLELGDSSTNSSTNLPRISMWM